MTSQFWWYVARSGGVVAWGLATASVLWGLLLSSRVLGPRSNDRKLLDLHRFLGGLTVLFALIHVVGLLLDETFGFGVTDVFIPFASDWEPRALAWGVISFYLVLAVELTSLMRDRVADRTWQYVHYAGFAVFLFGTIHGLRVGTDVENPLIWWPAAISSAAVVGLCAYRIFASGDPVPVVPRTEKRTENLSAAVLERTLSQLERLDPESYPAAVPPPTPRFEPLPTMDVLSSHPTAASPSAPERSGDALALFPARPAVRPNSDEPLPRQPPAPTRAPFDAPSFDRSLPTRVPQRLGATTAPAAGLGAWTPARSSERASSIGPPPPPDGALDPSTGEPDPQAYRKWLREWLEYVESQP